MQWGAGLVQVVAMGVLSGAGSHGGRVRIVTATEVLLQSARQHVKIRDLHLAAHSQAM